MTDSSTSLPTGTVTFLFTDIEESTPLAARLGPHTGELREQHYELIVGAVQTWNGHSLAATGDEVVAAFAKSSDAMHAALEAQRALCAHPWPEGIDMRVRIGIHTGEVRLMGTNYVGLPVHEAQRICAAGHGGQILVSGASKELAAEALPSGVTLLRLGRFELRGIPHLVEIFQLQHPDLPSEFSPLRTRPETPNNLPVQLTAFIGRTREIEAAADALRSARLVTLTGVGGVGKTRLAIELARSVGHDYEEVRIADLAPVSEPELVGRVVAEAMSLPQPSATAPGRLLGDDELLAAHLRDRAVLLVLDNCEHVSAACAARAEVLLRACDRLRVIATSLVPLGVAGEEIVPVLPLALEGSGGERSDAARLFLDRVRLHNREFHPSEHDEQTIDSLCRALDGIPLAIELAAAHTRALTLQEIEVRLADRFGFLTKGARTSVERQQTLRSAIDWGFGLLAEAERTMLARLSVFWGGFSLQGAEEVCSGRGIETRDVYRLVSSLVDKSFVVPRIRGQHARYFLLETIRAYGLEKLGGASNMAPVEPETPGARESALLVREAQFWTITHAGKVIRLKDSKGLRYLAILLARPGDDVPVLDLVDAVEGGGRSASAARRAIGDAGETLDLEAARQYRRRVADLGEEIEEARSFNDVERASRLADERDRLTEELTRAFGLGGRPRPRQSAFERARVSVTKAIRGAIGVVARNDPTLGAHLQASVKTGGRCAYVPIRPFRWDVRR